MKMWTTLSAGRRDLITVFVGSGSGGGNYNKVAPRKRERELNSFLALPRNGCCQAQGCYRP